ncbi:MAG: DUF4411 family protein [Phycisphaerae bacterium]
MLDANVLIDANRDYYPLERVPEFWEWLENAGGNGHAKIPVEVYEEIRDGKDNLAKWAKQDQISTALLFQEEVDVSLVAHATDQGYASDLTDDEVVKIGRDPFLIAHALKNNESRCVVTTEVSKPKKRRANRHLPDVCRDLGVKCCDTFEFLRALNFSTRWNSP